MSSYSGRTAARPE